MHSSNTAVQNLKSSERNSKWNEPVQGRSNGGTGWHSIEPQDFIREGNFLVSRVNID